MEGWCSHEPGLYYNLTTSSVEAGSNAHSVTVTELSGIQRDRVFEEQARRYPGFAEYTDKAAGIRTIPVLALCRA